MTGKIPIQYKFGSQPYCQKCKRQVDFWSIDLQYGLDPVYRGYHAIGYVYTGHDLIRLKVECHGEVFEKTYFRGIPE